VPKIRVVLDTCALLPYPLADLLLRLAEAEMYEPLWSEEILAEVERNLVEKFGVTPEKAARRVGHMRSAFPNAVVEDYENLIPAMTNHPKDRHVTAAAVRGGAVLIVTADLSDFPPESLSQYDIEAIHPDDFLQDQLDLAPEVTIDCLRQQRSDYTRPQFTFREFYLGLRKTVPNFTDLAVAAETAAWDPNDPMPLEIVSESEVMEAFFPKGQPDPTDPLGAAFMWWSALLDRAQYFTALQNLTWHPPSWGDYEWASERLSGASMMQFVERCPDDDYIAYVKFPPGVGHPARVFAEAPLTNVHVLTMVRCSDGWWRAWGLHENRFPSAEEVRGSSC
jgi:predicted nucleic acid-binding protein